MNRAECKSLSTALARFWAGDLVASLLLFLLTCEDSQKKNILSIIILLKNELTGLVLSMSYFGTQLDELLKRNKMRAVELARLSGVAESMISHFRSGEHTFVSTEALAALSQHISSDPQERALLVKAHLLDECQGPGSELVRVEIGDSQAKEAKVAYRAIPLPPDADAHMEIVRAWIMRDANVRAIVKDLAELLGSGAVEPSGGRKGKIDLSTPEGKEAFDAAESAADLILRDEAAKGGASAKPKPASYKARKRRARGAPGGS